MSDERKPLYFVLPRLAVPEDANAATLGSKACELLRLVRLGLPVPPAFVLGTDMCRRYFEAGKLPTETQELLRTGLGALEEATGRRFGGERRPLLVSVRSGAPQSMPGMMETVLNIGLCDRTLHGLVRLTGNPRLARDCYRRLVRDFMGVVHGASPAAFDAVLEHECSREGVPEARELDTASLGRAAEQSLEIASAQAGHAFPQEPMEQLLQAVEAVFRSWQSEKARRYRRLNAISDAPGTAVTVQAMVFGNAGSDSGAGVGFTRDPATGLEGLYLDFLFNAQGEDVVAGRQAAEDSGQLAQRLPTVAAQLQRLPETLEREFRDMQDFEFTVESGRLYLLQTRAGKRTPWAAVRIATDLVREGYLTPAEALQRLRDVPLEKLERTRLTAGTGVASIGSAVPASIGVATGLIALDSQRAATLAAEGRSVILVRQDIHTDDIGGIAAAAGVLTASGGRTSHAAVVARELGKVCLVNCRELTIEGDGSGCAIAGVRLTEGEEVTLDGNSGHIYRGRIEVVRERPEAELAEVAKWRAAASR
jgi:pyruvate, orthophosphate dikinase